ncbi:MAG: hypothetical protein H6Q04_1340, partial [Acidobacteria bacterium]|nr:hypothetical protein [Acidobacteriota bacterium]
MVLFACRRGGGIVQTEHKINLMGLSPEEIQDIVVQMDEPAFRARQ